MRATDDINAVRAARDRLRMMAHLVSLANELYSRCELYFGGMTLKITQYDVAADRLTAKLERMQRAKAQA
jgi:hypothetical protein